MPGAAGAAPATTAPKASAKTKAGKKGDKNKAGENPKAVWDVRKAKLSTLSSAAFPIVDRPETKKVLTTVVLNKAPRL